MLGNMHCPARNHSSYEQHDNGLAFTNNAHNIKGLHCYTIDLSYNLHLCWNHFDHDELEFYHFSFSFI